VLRLARLGPKYGFERLVVKDEGLKPRARSGARPGGRPYAGVLAGAKTFVVADGRQRRRRALGLRGRAPVWRARVYAPRSTPRMILKTKSRATARSWS